MITIHSDESDISGQIPISSIFKRNMKDWDLMRLETASNYDSWQCDTPSEKGEEETATSYEKELDLGFNMALIIRFDFVVKHILKAPGHLCICCHGLRPMLCLKKSFPVHEKS